jgi:NDP-4-keto-2,6-dideoxyhexose 3-C-methyltransferase
MIQQVAFDNICHEHFYYYSLFNLKKLLERHGFKVMDCQFNEINGGSFRLYVMKETADVSKFSSQPYRDVCKVRIDSVLAYEKELKLDSFETWDKFYSDICKLKTDVVNFILTEKAKGKTIYGYGASTKGNTLLQFFGLTSEHITAIADVSEYKHGLYTIATDILIISEQEMREAKPDYLLILPWHFISNFIEREKELRLSGTKFIVPCPKLQVL